MFELREELLAGATDFYETQLHELLREERGYLLELVSPDVGNASP